ncbi:MAG: ABC transporter permease subunit [Pseudonocardiaceae bacterium]|nr:ABC transporter permease subunit [Pseudonocardiaceae bacterium]
MTTIVVHTSNLFVRKLRSLVRQPFWLAVQLIQPLVWLLLFGSLFRGVAELPGFGTDSFISYIAPGMVIMMVLFTGAFSGMSLIEDMDRGVMNRLLVSPASRVSLLLGMLSYLAITLIVQALIVLGIAAIAGAEYPGGILGILVTLLSAVLLALAFGSLSNGLALLLRRFESVIAVAQFLTLPLVFTSSVLMNPALAPDWLQNVSSYNPVNWAVTASRDALSANPDWGSILGYELLLLALAAVMVWLSTRAFRAYQRSV